MPFRLLVLTRAKHLTRLGLIWWGHGMTPWPPLSMFSKWNQLSHIEGEERGGGEWGGSGLAWGSLSLTYPSIWSDVFAVQCTLFWCEAPLPTVTTPLPRKASSKNTFDRPGKNNKCRSVLSLLCPLWRCLQEQIAPIFIKPNMCVYVWPARPLLTHLFSFAWLYFLLFQQILTRGSSMTFPTLAVLTF